MIATAIRIEYMPLSDLKKWPRNPKDHDIGQLHQSIGRFGYVQPVMIDERSKMLVAGHGRLETLEQMKAKGDSPPERIETSDKGEWLVPVIRGVRFASDQEAEAFGIADNRHVELGGWDNAALADVLKDLAENDALDGVGFDAGELDEILAELDGTGAGGSETEDAGPQIDKAAELQKKWKVERGQLWEIPSKSVKGKAHRLLCGDSTSKSDVLRVLGRWGGESADAVFTSPPYAVGVDYGSYEDTIENLRRMLPALAEIWLDVVVPGGVAVVNFGDIVSAKEIVGESTPCEYPMAVEYWPIFRDAGWLLWSRRIWCKPNPRVHSPWCIQSNRAASDWEHIWTWKRPGDALLMRVDGEWSSCLGWRDSSKMAGVEVGKDEHGAGMALGIACWMLAVHSRPAAVVHEPFCGTGTTIVAAEQTGRLCCGIEIEPKYVAATLERLTLLGLEPRLVS